MPWKPAAAVLLAALLVLGAASCSSKPSTQQAATPPPPKSIGGTVISTAGSSNEMQVVVPQPIADRWTTLGGKGVGLQWVAVGGDGKTKSTPVGLSKERDSVTTLIEKMNSVRGTVPDRSALAGLGTVHSPAGKPVWVFSPLLDTRPPLDFTELAFDESPSTAVKTVRRAGDLPDLSGRDVTFVVTPVAGKQKKLSKLQVGYQHAVWEGLATAAGAKRVTFFDGAGTTPGTGTGPAIPVPNPNDKINADKTGPKSTCTLPTPALFVSDQPTLIDKHATLRALSGCLGTIKSSTKITVEGHTAGIPAADNTFAKNLSTQRATEVAALLKELDVPARNITKVVGYGSSRPLVKPPSSPKNRAVVVTFTSTS